MPLMIYCTAASTSFSDSISYITYLFRNDDRSSTTSKASFTINNSKICCTLHLTCMPVSITLKDFWHGTEAENATKNAALEFSKVYLKTN